MKFCISCGSELQENVEFCTNCGANVNQMSASQGSGSDTQQPNPGAQNTQFDDTLNKIKNLNYFNFVKETAVNPTATTDETGYNGWIQLGLLTLFTTLTFVNIMNGLVKAFTSNLGGLGGFEGFVTGIAQTASKSVVGSIAPRLFFIILIVYATFVFGAFFIQKYAHKNSNIGVTTFVNKFSGLLTPNLILVAAATVLGLMATEFTIQVALMLVMLSFLLMVIAYTYYMYNNIKIGGIDHFNVVIIGNVAVIAVVAIVVYTQIEPLLTIFNEISYYLF